MISAVQESIAKMITMKRKEDFRTLFIIWLAWFSCYLNWKYIFTIENKNIFWILEPIFFSVNCSLFFCCAVANHNIVHTPVFYNKKLNSLVNVILTISYGHPSSSYVPGHNLSHHKYTQTTKDFMRTSKVKYRWNFLNGLLFFFLITKDSLRNDINYFIAQRKLNRPIWRQVKLEIFSLVFFTIALLFVDYYKFFFLIYIPQYYAKWAITTINLLQHDGCEINKTEEQKKHNGARNFTGEFLNWFAMNNGFHQVHHMHPAMHWSILPQKHKELVEPFNHPNLNQPCMLTYIIKTYIYPGERVNYDGSPWIERDDGADEDWFFEDEETDSERADLIEETAAPSKKIQ